MHANVRVVVAIRWSFIKTDAETGEVRRFSSINFDYLRGGKFAEGWEVGSDKPWI